MSQQRITLFFPSTRGQRPQKHRQWSRFLSLPCEIRHRIYRHAGVPTKTCIDMNGWATYTKQEICVNPDPFDDFGRDVPPSLPLSLLSVCRSIRNEVEALLYGDNLFVISRTSRHGLRALERLGDGALRAMRCLLVRLSYGRSTNSHRQPTHSASWDRICYGYPEDPWQVFDTSLHHHSPQLASMVPQWERICNRLGESVTPEHFGLSVICDCEDLIAAQTMVQPTLSLVPLQKFAIRLSREPSSDLRHLEFQTQSHLLRKPETPETRHQFRFLKLPAELQLAVMRKSTLVASSHILVAHGRVYYPEMCSMSGPGLEQCRTILSGRPPGMAIHNCYCHTAHSAFNALCLCDRDRFPASYFLVNRHFRHLALAIFYSHNTFRVDTRTIRQHDQCSPTSPLRRFPPASLKYLTHLIIDLDGMSDASPDQGACWQDTVDLLVSETIMSTLKLEIRFAEFWYAIPYIPCHVDPDVDGRPNYQRRMQQHYMTMFERAAGLKDLQDLYVHLNWDYSYVNAADTARYAHEKVLEQSVMGVQYNAWERGKGHKHIDYEP